MSSVKYSLDSSALLAAVNGEPGGDIVQPLLRQSAISCVNLAESIGKLVLKGADAHRTLQLFKAAVADIIPFDHQLAALTVGLVLETRPLGLSLGDRACLATAMHHNLEVITADKIWGKLKLGVKIRLIR